MPWDKIPESLPAEDRREKKEAGRNLSYREALREAHRTALERDERVFLFGEGIDDPCGVFGTTAGLKEEFGPERVFDTPICENALTGVALGAALAGMRPVLVHMRVDFLLMSMDQIVNHAAKWKYMFSGKTSLPVVIRSIIGGGWGSAAQHSQALQALFAHVPGLRVVMPSTAYDAKGLLLSAIACDGPVIFIEHRWLYDRKDIVPQEPYLVPLGKAKICRPGSDISIIADSYMTMMAMECAQELAKENIEAEVIDLRTIKPLDKELILESVRRTGRALIADTGYKFCGTGAEISAMLAEEAYPFLKAPLARAGLPDAPTPASSLLEKEYYPKPAEIISAARRLCSYGK